MSLPKYVKPPIAGITMAAGAFTQQPIYDGVLSYQADAQAYAAALKPPATLVNAATDSACGITFEGIKTTDAAQPWMVTWDGINFFFAGIAILQEVAAQGGTIGADGTWVQQTSGVWLFMVAPPAPVTPPVVVPNPADVQAWDNLMGVTSMSTQQFQTTVLQALAAIGKAVGAKGPGMS